LSISQQIATTLATEWVLAGTLAVANMHFSTGWYDSRYQNHPQVTVSKAWTPEPRWFGPTASDGPLTYISWDKYFVDCWLTIDRDILGESEYESVEDMMTECFRILNAERLNFTGAAGPLGHVMPLDRGTAMHETNRQPYILHIQMLAQANYRSGTP